MAAAYRRGVDALLDGRLDDAARDLAAPAAAGMPGAPLALAKLHLQREEGEPARRHLAALLADPPGDPGMHAYLRLLSAVAAGMAGDPDAALADLEDAMRLDPRVEVAARALRRRLEKRRPPVLRF